MSLCSHYPTILQQLLAAMDKEEDGRCIDNIIAAVCRMVTAKPEAMPLDQVCMGSHFTE